MALLFFSWLGLSFGAFLLSLNDIDGDEASLISAQSHFAFS
jgi:hypothetical protein